jgi:hypothetical protein
MKMLRDHRSQLFDPLGQPSTVLRPPLLGLIALAVAFLVSCLQAETTVDTVGGGPLLGKPAFGNADGSTLQEAQFHTPSGCALDVLGRYLYVADRDNNCLRILDLPGDTTRTLITGLPHPVALAVDSTNNLYIVAQGSGNNGSILLADAFGDTSVIVSNLANPSAVALDSMMNLYVTEINNAPLRGTLKKFSAGSWSAKLLRDDLRQPAGLAVTDSGMLAVTEMENHTVKLIHPETGAVQAQWGSPGISGFHDGYPDRVLFNQPQHIAKAPNGNLIIADRRNHRVRVLNANSIVTTLYGIDPKDWGLSNTNWPNYPGWLDGASTVAEAREPVGVTVAADGTVYSTEVYYHIIRKAAASSATGPTTGSGSTNVPALFPILEPDTGYLPMGETIRVTDPNTNLFVNSQIFYTTDGTEPTTNSLQLLLTNHVGYISWTDSLRDLTSLRVKVFLGNNNTALVSGRAPSVNYIGVHRDIAAGCGASAIVPVVLNLRSNQMIQTLQFRLEVAPITADTPPLEQDIQALDLTTNSFVQMAGSRKAGTEYFAGSYQAGKARGIAVTFLGSFANYEIQEYGTAGLFAVPLPPGVVEGNEYSIRVLEYSATSDAGQTLVPLTSMPTRTITITNLSYLVGDSSPGVWYNAGDFGRNNNESLDNADANAVLYASLGYRLPFLMSDVFDAMDAFPEDAPPAAGGDGHIRYLDWQTIFYRSLRLPDFTRNFTRSHGPDGSRIAWESGGPAPSRAPRPLMPANAIAQSEDAWFRQVRISSLTLENTAPNSRISLPIFVQVKPGYQVAGLQFRALIQPVWGAPPLDRQVEFIPASQVPPPAQRLSLGPDSVAVAWNLRDFRPAMQGSNLIGYVRFVVPRNAAPGQAYRLTFAGADGAPDFTTQYDFETVTSTAWVSSPAIEPDVPMSAEWITHYFGRLESPWARPDSDADHDGVNNDGEYARGTSPVTLRLFTPETLPAGSTRILRWFGQQGRTYALEGTDDLHGGPWESLAELLAGRDDLIEVKDTPVNLGPRFYRVRIVADSAASATSIPSQTTTIKQAQ